MGAASCGTSETDGDPRLQEVGPGRRAGVPADTRQLSGLGYEGRTDRGGRNVDLMLILRSRTTWGEDCLRGWRILVTVRGTKMG